MDIPGVLLQYIGKYSVSTTPGVLKVCFDVYVLNAISNTTYGPCKYNRQSKPVSHQETCILPYHVIKNCFYTVESLLWHVAARSNKKGERNPPTTRVRLKQNTTIRRKTAVLHKHEVDKCCYCCLCIIRM